jgi:hypothetical protein
MNKYFGIFALIISSSFLTSLLVVPNVPSFGSNEFYDEECADEMFDKYMKDSEPEFDKYLEGFRA